MSNWLYLIVETILDARDGAKEPKYRERRNPLSGEALGRDLVGLGNTHDSLEQRAARDLLHNIFKRH